MQEQETPASRPQAMLPFFMGAPWTQRFGGRGSELNLKEWEAQIKYFIGIQGLRQPQQLQFILGSLEGEAKREILALEEANRDTAEKIFDRLTLLYGDNTPIAALRAQFFNCRQGPKQSIRSFALQILEMFSRLRRRGSAGLGDGDALARDQFVMGLRDGHTRQALKAQLRRDPNMTFEDMRQEALELEEDQSEQGEQHGCMNVRSSETSTVTAVTAAAAAPETDWKQELRTEIMKDVQEQITAMSKAILEELRASRPTAPRPPRERSQSEGAWEGRWASNRSTRPKFQWDDQGRPICNKCGEAGHVSRQCPPRRASQGDF